jgi:hypothetical protein
MTYFRSAKVVRLTIGVSFLYLLFLLLPAVPNLTPSKSIKADCPDADPGFGLLLAEEESDRALHRHATFAWQQEHQWGTVGLLSPELRDASQELGAWLFALLPRVPHAALIFVYYHYTLCPPADSLPS